MVRIRPLIVLSVLPSLALPSLALPGFVPPAIAQMSPPPGVLTLPKQHSASSAPAAPVTPPQAAPVAPVERVAPYSAPPVTEAAAKPYVPAVDSPAERHRRRHHHTPVVQAPSHVHAERPPAAKPTAAAPPPAKPVPPASEPVVPAASGKPVETIGSVTKLPLPRWASLRADDVNMRVGPGMRFPIEWQYHRRDLPVRILRENDVWRLVEDQDGVKGWVHTATLIGRRSFVVKVPEATMRASASDDAAPVARLKQGVVGRLKSCDAASAWCKVQVGDYEGFLRRTEFFGSDPGEAVGN